MGQHCGILPFGAKMAGFAIPHLAGAIRQRQYKGCRLAPNQLCFGHGKVQWDPQWQGAAKLHSDACSNVQAVHRIHRRPGELTLRRTGNMAVCQSLATTTQSSPGLKGRAVRASMAALLNSTKRF